MVDRRVLITGSRHWADYRTLALALSIQVAGCSTVTVVHGGASGADALAGKYAQKHPKCVEEVHLADWNAPCADYCKHTPRFRVTGEPYCPAAGVIRNQTMVDLGADICLAFPLGESKGTRDCMRRAEAAGITVVNHGDEYLL